MDASQGWIFSQIVLDLTDSELGSESTSAVSHPSTVYQKFLFLL